MGHCKFAEMLYSSDELVVVVCFFPKTASTRSTSASRQSVKSVFAFIHYAFGGVCATSAIRTLALHFGFGAEQACSSAARVTSSLPISGVSLRRQLVLRLASFTRRFLTPRFAACGPSSGVVRSPFFTAYMFLATLSYTRWVLLLGQTGRVSRLRSSSPTAIVSSTFSLSRIASVESLRSAAVGCISRPRSSTWRSSLFSISSLFFLASSRIACYCSLMTLVPGISIFKFSSGVVSRSTGVERLVLFHLPAELEFLCGH